MHFAFPPRKTSHPPPYAARSRSGFLRYTQLRNLLILAVGALVTLYLLSGLFSGSSSVSIPAGTPKAVVVTTLDPSLSESYKAAIKANRKHYAAKHGKQPSIMTLPKLRIVDMMESQATLLSSPTRPTTLSATTQAHGRWSPPCAMQSPSTLIHHTSSISPAQL